MLDEFDTDKDITSVRSLELPNGNILYLKRTDPYGFLVFNLDKGQLPDYMKDNFTSFFEADKALQQYLIARQMETEDLTSPKTDKRVAKN